MPNEIKAVRVADDSTPQIKAIRVADDGHQEIKKKVATELPSEQPKVSSSSATQKTVKQKPSESSGSENNLFSGYPGKEEKKYQYKNGAWYEYSATSRGEKGDQHIDQYDKQITDPNRVNSLNKFFKKDASTSKYMKTFTGYPGQEGAEYRIVNGTWEKKSYGKDGFTPIANDDSVKSLNAYFKQSAKKSSKEDVEASYITKTIDKDLINADEEDLVPKLKNMFKGTDNDIFDFEETGFGYDALKVRNRLTGEETTINLDNWGSDRNNKEAKLLKGFIDINLKFKDQANNKKKIEDLYKKKEESPWMAVSIDKEIADIQADINADEVLKKNYALSEGKYTSAAIYNKDAIKSVKNKMASTSANAIRLKSENEQLIQDRNKAQELLTSGKITQQEYDFKYKDKFDQKQQEIISQAKDVQSNLSTLKKEFSDVDAIAGHYVSTQEDRGNFGTGVVKSFIKGVEAPFLTVIAQGMEDPESFKKSVLNATSVGITTDEYLSSASRSDFEKAIFGLTESIGTSVAGVGGLGSAASMYVASYGSYKDEINNNPEFDNVPEYEKMLLSAGMAAPAAILEKFGVDKLMQRSPLGKKLTNYILSSAIKSIPKKASSEVLEAAIAKSLKAAVAKGLINVSADGAIEGITEGVEDLTENTIKSVYNSLKGGEYFDTPKTTGEWLNSMTESAKLGFIGGATVGAISQSVSISKDRMTALDFDKMSNMIDDENLKDIFKTSLQAKVLNKEITKAQSFEILSNLAENESVLNKIPKDLNPEDKFNAFKLISEKIDLEKNIQGKDNAIVSAQTERINAINEELKAISINNKTQENATTESAEQQQESTTESNISEREGANEGQQEVGQTEGSERTTEEQGTNISDSNISSEEEVVSEPQILPTKNKTGEITGYISQVKDLDGNTIDIEGKTEEEVQQKIDDIQKPIEQPTLDDVKSLDVSDKTNLQKVQSFLDNALNDLDTFGKETLGINLPVAVAKVVLKTVKTLVDAGVSLEQAFKQAAEKHNVQEVDIADTLTALSNKKKETQASTAAKNISKKEKTSVTVDEYTALKDQIRLEARAARESKRDLKAKQADLIAKIKDMSVKGKIDTKKMTAINNKIAKLNLDNQVKVDEFLNYIDNTFKTVDYDSKLSKAKEKRKAISKNLKDRANPFAKLAREFSKLNVNWVENIEEYNDIAEKVYNSVKASRFNKGELTLKEEADIQEVYDYFNKEKKSQSQRLEDNYRKLYEETTGNSANGKTISELRAELASTPIDYTDEKRQSIKDHLENFADMAKNDPDVDDIIKEAVNVDTDLLDIKEAVSLLEALDTYFANGTTAKLSNIMAVYRGKFNAKNSKLAGKRLALFGSKKVGRVMNEYLTNLNIIAERIFGGPSGGRKFLEETGFTSVYNGMNRAEAETRVKSDEYFNKYKSVKDFDSIENIYERKALSFLMRSPEVDEDGKFFETRVKLLKQSQETLAKGSDEEKVMADVYKKVLDNIDIDNAKDINDIIKNVSDVNLSAVTDMQEIFAEQYDRLYEFALNMHNTMLAKDNLYTPDIYSKTSTEANKVDLDPNSFAFGNFANINISPDKNSAGVLIESSRPKSLPKGKYISLDFENDMFNAYRLALTDMYTAEGIRQFDSYMKSDNIETIIADSDDRKIINDAMNGYVNDRKGKTYADKTLITEVKKFAGYLSKLGAFRALGSIRQFPIQFASAVANALVVTGFDSKGIYIDFKAPFDPRIKKLMDESGRSIANRGTDSAISAMQKEVDVMPKLNTSGKVAKVVEFPFEKVAKANAVVMKYTLAKADNWGARIMWWAFYKKSLADQGIELDMNNINDEAADYAQSMTDRQAEVSDTALRGKVFRSKNGATMFIRDVLMPFAGFSLNQKNRLYSDLRTASSKSSSPKDRSFAFRSIAATSSEVVVTTAIRYQFAKYMIYFAASMLGLDDEDEEVKDLYDKLDKYNKENAYSRVIQDVVSPAPIFDKYTLEKINSILDMSKLNNPDMKDFDNQIKEEDIKRISRGELKLTQEEIDKKKEEYLLDNKFSFYTTNESDWGMLGILPEKISETKELMLMYKTGQFEKEQFGKKTTYFLTENDRKKLLGPLTLKLAANVAPAETDMISNKAVKIIKGRGLTEEKFNKYNELKKNGKVTPLMERLIRDTKAKTEDIIYESGELDAKGNISESQINEYMKLRNIYGTGATYYSKEIMEGKKYKDLINK